MAETETQPKNHLGSFNDFVKMIYNKKYQSVWTCCLGRNQSGKTDFNLLLLERLHTLGLADGFGSNIPDLDTSKCTEPFEIDFIEDFATLKKRCQMLNPDPEKHGIKRYFFLADEMGNWAPKDKPWLNVDFIREMQQVRKYGLCMLGTAIDRVDSRILNEKHFHGYYMKVSKSNPTIAVYYNWINHRRMELIKIPRTKIKFNTWHSASFYMEPRAPNDLQITVLNPEHEIVKKYLECGETWRESGIHRQTGKRAIGKVLQYHMKHCLNSMQESSESKEIVEQPSTD